jgi:hypothetical protein
MKIIVTGGRNYNNPNKVDEVLSRLNPTEVIHGACSGADELAMRWAISNQVKHTPYPADWGRYGYRAGPVRNRLMIISNPDATLVAFPGGKGTANAIGVAESINLNIIKVEE